MSQTVRLIEKVSFNWRQGLSFKPLEDVCLQLQDMSRMKSEGPEDKGRAAKGL